MYRTPEPKVMPCVCAMPLPVAKVEMKTPVVPSNLNTASDRLETWCRM